MIKFLLFCVGCCFLFIGTDILLDLTYWFWSDPILTSLTKMKMELMSAAGGLITGLGLVIFWYLFRTTFTQHN